VFSLLYLFTQSVKFLAQRFQILGPLRFSLCAQITREFIPDPHPAQLQSSTEDPIPSLPEPFSARIVLYDIRRAPGRGALRRP